MVNLLALSAKNGERGASGGSAQLSSLICTGNRAWEPTREPQTSPCSGDLLIRPESRENIQDVSGFTKMSGNAFETQFCLSMALKSCHTEVKNPE